MKTFLLYIFLFFIGIQSSLAQDSLAHVLKRYNTNDIPYISVQELAMPKTDALILDAREPNEYKVSHLKDAIFVGYTHFNIEQAILQLKDKQQTIVVYCSLGIRSETISKKLKNAGYTAVYNLYGGIFEWKNHDLPVYNLKNKETDSVHAFSKIWGKWLHNGEKVYN